jgi:hypothetical protein
MLIIPKDFHSTFFDENQAREHIFHRNAEGLPIEGIDRIKFTLNPFLNIFINRSKKHVDPKNHLTIYHSSYYGTWSFVTIQTQRINPFIDIRFSLAESVYELIQKRVILFDITIPKFLIYLTLEFFVYEVKEIEFYFDFKENHIKGLDPVRFKDKWGTLYSPDARYPKGRPVRKSIIDFYDRRARLIKVNQLPHAVINSNPYCMRLEFRLTKQNAAYRTLDNLYGNYETVIARYTPYLAVLFSRFCSGNILIDSKDHPHFNAIKDRAAENTQRYRGKELAKRVTPKSDNIQLTILNAFLRYGQTP